MDQQHRRLLNEIGANVEKIAADMDKLKGMPLNYALRRGIQEISAGSTGWPPPTRPKPRTRGR
jgi:hypothetical protein